MYRKKITTCSVESVVSSCEVPNVFFGSHPEQLGNRGFILKSCLITLFSGQHRFVSVR